MYLLRFCNFSHLSYLLAFSLVFPLVACSGGDGGSSSSSSSSPSLSWVAPSEREDGAALSPSEITGFRIYYGTESGNYSNTVDIDDHTATQAVLTGIPSGDVYIVMTTIDADGRESSFSAPEIEVTF